VEVTAGGGKGAQHVARTSSGVFLHTKDDPRGLLNSLIERVAVSAELLQEEKKKEKK
jgi:hypothetical protein